MQKITRCVILLAKSEHCEDWSGVEGRRIISNEIHVRHFDTPRNLSGLLSVTDMFVAKYNSCKSLV